MSGEPTGVQERIAYYSRLQALAAAAQVKALHQISQQLHKITQHLEAAPIPIVCPACDKPHPGTIDEDDFPTEEDL